MEPECGNNCMYRIENTSNMESFLYLLRIFSIVQKKGSFVVQMRSFDVHNLDLFHVPLIDIYKCVPIWELLVHPTNRGNNVPYSVH